MLIRLSPSPGDVLDDHVSTPRGFAMKVLDVEGERLPGSEQQRRQDFLLVNGQAFRKRLGTDRPTIRIRVRVTAVATVGPGGREWKESGHT